MRFILAIFFPGWTTPATTSLLKKVAHLFFCVLTVRQRRRRCRRIVRLARRLHRTSIQGAHSAPTLPVCVICIQTARNASSRAWTRSLRSTTGRGSARRRWTLLTTSAARARIGRTWQRAKRFSLSRKASASPRWRACSCPLSANCARPPSRSRSQKTPTRGCAQSRPSGSSK